MSEVLRLIDSVTEFNDLSEFMHDEDLDKALEYVIQLIAKPDIPGDKAHQVIVRLQAISAKMGMLARYYTTFAHTGDKEASKKKNVYYTANEEIDKIVAALKYSARSSS